MDALLYWNEVALDASAQDHTGTPPKFDQGGPTKTSRALAIVHLAMYDAFVSINGGSAPYLSDLMAPPPGASAEAALGEAAYVTLKALYPSQSRTFQRARDAFLWGLPSSQALEDGRTHGQKVATMLLNQRMNDGSADCRTYQAKPLPGKHRVDPLNPTQGFLSPFWGEVAPFALPTMSGRLDPDFLAEAPPALDSSQYETDFNDVKEKGALTGGTRTPEETTVGLFWAYDGAQKLGTPPRLYNQIVRTIAIQKGNMLEQNVRLFALVNMAMADAGIQCWLSKYHYELWRPVVGIREADPGWGPTGCGDDNPETEGDPYWLPFGAPRTNQPGIKSFTPNFPAYPSGHATFGAASLDMVRLFYGTDNIAFDFVSDELNGESVDVDGSIRTHHKRNFNRLSDAINENGRSRVYLGIHWQFDSVGGIKSGKRIADYIYTHQLRPVP
ncbi:MAG: vanadium-dependent haloperoxidase [Cyanobacteria bacterium RM1_2_2]|nr:vanadium-dependent haloperoxidase [Cyanobacteria bacterium RM1_2_2]